MKGPLQDLLKRIQELVDNLVCTLVIDQKCSLGPEYLARWSGLFSLNIEDSLKISEQRSSCVVWADLSHSLC